MQKKANSNIEDALSEVNKTVSLIVSAYQADSDRYKTPELMVQDELLKQYAQKEGLSVIEFARKHPDVLVFTEGRGFLGLGDGNPKTLREVYGG